MSCNGQHSDLFPCNVGVRQGENLSPFLFAVYLNDVEEFMFINNVQGLSELCENLENEFNVYLRLFVLLYADDTILLSEKPTELQYQLDVFHQYCKTWHLKVNSSKSKIVIFGRHISTTNTVFKYNNEILELVNSFKYLGVTFSKSGSYNLNIKELFDKSNRAMYGVIGKCRKHNLSIDCKLDMFDKVVKPIILYGCEVWGFNQSPLLERLHLKFCKHILNLKPSTPNYMVYGELGRYPITINVKVRMISFWAKLQNSQGKKISSKLYYVMRNYNSPWFNYIKKILNDCGLSYIWHNTQPLNVIWLKNKVFHILYDQFKQSWIINMYNSSKASNYRIYKHTVNIEKYLLRLPDQLMKYFCKFRTGNAKLPIEVGRWRDIPRENRICHLCNQNEIGDEFHYIFNCTDISIKQARQLNVSKYYYTHPNIHKFNQLFNVTNRATLIKLCKFIRIIMERVSSPG